ncbi:hypothetical protein TNCV_3273441 [Trichonephila clavipes]|nr:hypothetical protein TNCV_3273441 [Trichonephila clavipes]
MSPNSKPTIVMLQAKAGFVSKYNVFPFGCPCPPFIAPLGWFSVKSKRSNEPLTDIPWLEMHKNKSKVYPVNFKKSQIITGNKILKYNNGQSAQEKTRVCFNVDIYRWIIAVYGPVEVKRLGTVGVKVLEKRSKRYRISMTMSVQTHPMKLRQLQKIRLGS